MVSFHPLKCIPIHPHTQPTKNEITQVWDRRTMRNGRQSNTPVGIFIGHTDGLTHLNSKGDGRYLLSNSKDQTIKIWDARKMADRSALRAAERASFPRFRWDYRWMDHPAHDRLVQHPMDGALSTLRGHRVLNTLIRAYWSPALTTGQRYVYSGSADGVVRIWDILSNTIVRALPGRSRREERTIRDCSWHPYLPVLTTGTTYISGWS